jgi:hypothetical protein
VASFKKIFRELIIPAGLLSALIIGAGMFSLPFVFDRAGILVSVFYLIAFSLMLAAVHLMYAEVTEETPGDHRFVGYARLHLGRSGFALSLLITGFTIILVLLIYLLLSPSFFRLALPGWPPLAAVLIFWLSGTLAITAGIKRAALLEAGLTGLIIIFILALFFAGFGRIGQAAADSWYNPGFVLLPFGAVLFSLAGRSAISSIRDYFKKEKISPHKFPKAIVLGTIVPAAVYLLFSLAVITLSPKGVTEDAVSGLAFSPLLLRLFGLLGLLALWTSYVPLGIELREIIRLDFKVPLVLANALVSLLPLGIYLLVRPDFIVLVGLAGAIFSGLESAMVIAMWQKVKKRLSVAVLLIPVFLAGAVYELLGRLS